MMIRYYFYLYKNISTIETFLSWNTILSQKRSCYYLSNIWHLTLLLDPHTTINLFQWKDIEEREPRKDNGGAAETKRHNMQRKLFVIPSFVFSVCLTDLFPSQNWNVHVRCPNVFVTVHLPLDNMSKTVRVVTTINHYYFGWGRRANDDLRWKIYFSGVGQMLEFAQSIKTCFLLRFSSRCQDFVPFFKKNM